MSRSAIGDTLGQYEEGLRGTIRNPRYLGLLRAAPYVPSPVPAPAECLARRVAYQMTQEQLGEALGVSSQRVAAFEDGTIIPGADGDVWVLKVYADMSTL